MRRKRINPKIKVYKQRAALFLSVALGLISFGLITEYLSRDSEEVEFVDDERRANFDPNFPFGRPEQLLDRATLRAAFIRAHGGAEAIEAMRSIRMVGAIIDREGVENEFRAIKKRPDNLLINFRNEPFEITFGVDSGEIWQRISRRGFDPLFPEVAPEQRSQILELAQFFNPVAQVLIQERGRVLEIRESELEGVPKLEVRIRPEGAERESLVVLDPKTMLPEAVHEFLPDGTYIRSNFFEDYRVVGGVPIPFGVKTKMGDEVLNEVRLRRVDPNVGTMSVAFEKPVDLSVAVEP